MALRKCHECGKEISSTAATCPSCGAKARMSNGKKIIIGIALGLLFVPFIAQHLDETRQREATAQRAAAARSHAELKATEFQTQGQAVVQKAQAALTADDLTTAKSILDPWATVKTSEMNALRAELAAKTKVKAEAAEKADLLKRAAALKPSDGAEGEKIYARLSALEPERTEFKTKLSAFKKTHEKQAAAAAHAELLANRQNYARALENQMLSKGMSVDVVAKGKENTTLHVKYVLVSKALVYKFNHNADLMAEIRLMGFTKVVLTDGYDETWTLDLTKKRSS